MSPEGEVGDTAAHAHGARARVVVSAVKRVWASIVCGLYVDDRVVAGQLLLRYCYR